MSTRALTVLSMVVFAVNAVASDEGGRAATLAPRSGPVATGWVANGATACKKYLIPAFLAPVLPQPNGTSEARADGHSCVFGAESKDGEIAILIDLMDFFAPFLQNGMRIFDDFQNSHRSIVDSFLSYRIT